MHEALELFGSFYAEPLDADTLIDELGLSSQRDTPYKKLSGGQKQRLSVALELVGDPRIAILDDLWVLELIAQGLTNRGIAGRLFISEATVKTHLIHIYTKLDVDDRAAAVAVAYDRGLLRPGQR